MDPTRLDDYVALSYCWGGDQAVKTTKATLEKHKTGIPIYSLPATIRDAITVTRRVGIGFLWVDSLCIIQDSPDQYGTNTCVAVMVRR